MSNPEFHRVRQYDNFELGEHYIVGWGYPRATCVTKFIRATTWGFNFLDIKTNKCVLKHHLYRAKSGSSIGKFSVNKKFKTRKIIL